MALDGQRFCLKWNDFRSSVTAVFEDLRQDGELVDITLCCEGKKVKAHRMMLSACSPYFRDVLKDNPSQHPVFFLKDTTFADLQAVIQFVYNGEVNVTQAQLSSFLKTAEMLQVKGLTGDDEKDSAPPPPSRPPPQPPAPPHHRAAPLSRPPPPPPMMTPAPAARPLPPTGHKRPMPSPAPSPAKRPAPLLRADDQYIESVTLSDSPPPPQPPAASAGAPSSPAHRRRLSGGSGSGGGGPATPMGSEPSADAAAASPAGDSSHSLPGHPPPDQPPMQEQMKVEKVEEVDEGDESLEAALGSMGDYEGAYGEHDPGMMFPGADLSQGGGMGMQPRTSDGGASGSAHRSPFLPTFASMSGMGAAPVSSIGAPAASGIGPSPVSSVGAPAASGVGARPHPPVRPRPVVPVGACTVCGREFMSASTLRAHQAVHRGDSSCTVCHKLFATRGSLKKHVITAHGLNTWQQMSQL